MPTRTPAPTHHQVIEDQHPVVRPQTQAINQGALCVADEGGGVAVVLLLMLVMVLCVGFVCGCMGEGNVSSEMRSRDMHAPATQ